MTAIAMAEFALAVVVGVIYIGQLIGRVEIKSEKRLRVCLLLTFIWLVIDGFAYVLLKPGYPFVLEYVVNLFAYSFGCILMIFFIGYRTTYISEKIKFNPWLYRIPSIVIGITFALIVFEYVRGNIVQYDNGAIVGVSGVPIYIALIQMIVLIYLPFVAISKRKAIGTLPVVLFGVFDIIPIISMIVDILTGYELTVLFSSIEIIAVVIFLQRGRVKEYFLRDVAQKLIVDNNTRMMALEDEFESLYDVNLETGDYELFVKGQTLYDEASHKFISKKEFFSDSRINASTLVYTDDKAAFIKVMNKDFIREVLSKNDYYDQYFRFVIDEKIIWFKMRIVYKDANKENVIFGVFNAEKEMKAKEEEKERRLDLIKTVSGTESTYIINPYNDSFIVINQNDYLEDNYPSDETYTESIGRYINEDVYEGDREETLNALSIENIIEYLKTNSSIHRKFRDVSSGVPLWYEARVKKLSDKEILLSFSNKHKETIDELLTEKFRDNYFGLYYVNLDTGLVQILKSGYEDVTGKPGEVVYYKDLLENIAATTEGETVEFFNLIKDADYIRKHFAKIDTAYRIYKSYLFEENRWAEITGKVITRTEDGTPLIFALAFNLLDDESCEKEEASLKLKETTKKLDAEIQRSDLLFETFNAGKWVYGISKDDKVISASYSNAVYKATDQGPYSGNPMGWIERVFYEDRERALAEFLAPIYDHSGKTVYNTAFRVVGQNGEIKWSKSAGRVVRYEDGTAEYFGMNIDLTDQIAEQEKHKQELSTALEKAENANAAKSEFLFNMSHDIRTPMNAILGFTDLLKKKLDDEKLLGYVEKTQEAGTLLLKLINSVLDMSRIESGKIVLEETPGDIRFSFESIEGTMQEIARSKKIKLSFEFGTITDYFVYADYERCLRVFVNIITNAIKYNKEGGYVKVKCEQIGKREDGYGIYRYTFEDNGIGMSKEFQEHVFEEFAREENSTTRGIQGTGIGLAVCKSFIDLMKGSIECKSQQGVGTTFIVTIPFKIQSENERKQYVDPETKELTFAEEFKQFEGKKVLLVEDNELNLEIAEEILKEKGLIVETATDGTIAVERMREKGPDYYDFILMDIQMPTMGGYEATEAIRMFYPDSNIPIIALSANAFEEDRIASLKAGMNEHIAKPINTTELFNVLSKFL